MIDDNKKQQNQNDSETDNQQKGGQATETDQTLGDLSGDIDDIESPSEESGSDTEDTTTKE